MNAVFRFFFLVALLVSPVAEARSLFWQDMAVRASLDKEGRLHVREQQTMVFSGSWNGGERDLRVRPGQHMQFEGISRLDKAGLEVPLIRGNLKLVDHWDHGGSTTIRWRSRLPADPPFNSTEITYVLHYSLSNILMANEGGYLLNHDFCFSDRSGVVKNFRLDLSFDPVWQSDPVSMVRKEIPPGQGVVLRQHLTFSGEGRPATFQEQSSLPVPVPSPPPQPAPIWLRVLLLCLLGGGALWRIRRFFQWERGLDRFVRLESVDRINHQWLEQELFVHKPEMVGATWDKTSSTAEVAAVLARLVQEGRMASWMEPYRLPFLNLHIPGIPSVLHLKLLQPRASFSGYERKLIKGLFVDNSMTTNTKVVRSYYRKKQMTFDPVATIREPLQKQMKKLTDEGKNSLGMIWMPTTALAVVGFFLLLANSFLHQGELVTLEIPGVVLVALCWIGGGVAALRYRQSVLALAWRLLFVLSAVACAFAAFLLFLLLPVSALLLLGLFFMAAASVNNITNLARSRESAAGLALRRRFAAARNYFKQELAREKPDIFDSWFPYLLAFGLGPKVDSWFRKYGSFPGSGTVTTGSPSGSGFSGGGAFGGGGSSGSWSAAVGSLAASSSASSSGGGSGGGGSSGGGGGGGW